MGSAFTDEVVRRTRPTAIELKLVRERILAAMMDFYTIEAAEVDGVSIRDFQVHLRPNFDGRGRGVFRDSPGWSGIQSTVIDACPQLTKRLR